MVNNTSRKRASKNFVHSNGVQKIKHEFDMYDLWCFKQSLKSYTCIIYILAILRLNVATWFKKEKENNLHLNFNIVKLIHLIPFVIRITRQRRWCQLQRKYL